MGKINMNKINWTPEIYYQEDNEGLTKGLPFINVQEGYDMPGMLFVYEARDIEEEENELEKEIILRSYVNMDILKQRLDIETLNKVRNVLGLSSLLEAQESGSKINTKITENLKEGK